MHTNFKRQKLGNIPPNLQVKWPIYMLDEGFVPFPKKLLRVLSSLYPNDTTAREIAVILAIVDFRREGQTRFPSPEFLAYVAGLSHEEFEETIGQLVTKEWLQDSTPTEENKNFLLEGLERKVLATAQGT